jgi:two-component system LytT family sensor kinase
VVYRCLDRVVWNEPPLWRQRILEQGTGYYLAMLLLPAVFWLAGRWPFRLTLARVGMYALAAVVCSVIHTSLMWGTRIVLSPLMGLGPYDYGAMPMRYFMEFPQQLIGFAMWVAAYTIYHNWLRTKDLETQLVSARLENLSHQLQPHFLFNALNAVSATMYEDLGLEDRLTFEIACDERAEGTRVPALLLQPLVENAVEHGQDPVSGRLDIGIGVQCGGGFVNISIRDHGRGVVSNGNGHGLSNARKRLATVYGDRASLSLMAHPEGGAIVRIQLPE